MCTILHYGLGEYPAASVSSVPCSQNMAEKSEDTATVKALRKLEDQLTCAICLEDYKEPKLLHCFHIFCKECLERLVVQEQQGELSLRCPTCRQSTFFSPATKVSDLQPAFHISHLFEIQDAFKKVKLPQNLHCEKCTKSSRIATNFCRDCGKFICERCSEMHSEWEEFSSHEVVGIEEIEGNMKQLVPPKKAVTLFCSLHKGMKLDLYCETCNELICLHCTVQKHSRPKHKYDLVSDTFERHKSEIVAFLQPIEKQLGVANKVLEQLNVRLEELADQETTNEAEIRQQIQQLQEVFEARKAELISQNHQYIQMKMKNIAAQKDEVEAVQTQLASCLSFMNESLRTGNQVEVMKMKTTVMKQIKEMINKFKPAMLHPCEPANVEFEASPELAQAYQQFGTVFLKQETKTVQITTEQGVRAVVKKTLKIAAREGHKAAAVRAVRKKMNYAKKDARKTHGKNSTKEAAINEKIYPFSGQWKGYYVQYRRKQEMPCTLIIDQDGNMAARGNDISRYSISGKIEPDGTFTFNKQYEGPVHHHAVIYSGSVEWRDQWPVLRGKWNIHSFGDEFMLTVGDVGLETSVISLCCNSAEEVLDMDHSQIRREVIGALSEIVVDMTEDEFVRLSDKELINITEALIKDEELG